MINGLLHEIEIERDIKFMQMGILKTFLDRKLHKNDEVFLTLSALNCFLMEMKWNVFNAARNLIRRWWDLGLWNKCDETLFFLENKQFNCRCRCWICFWSANAKMFMWWWHHRSVCHFDVHQVKVSLNLLNRFDYDTFDSLKMSKPSQICERN